MRGQKYKKIGHIPNDLSFFTVKAYKKEYYFESHNWLIRNKLLIKLAKYDANINIIPIFAGQKHSTHL